MSGIDDNMNSIKTDSTVNLGELIATIRSAKRTYLRVEVAKHKEYPDLSDGSKESLLWALEQQLVRGFYQVQTQPESQQLIMGFLREHGPTGKDLEPYKKALTSPAWDKVKKAVDAAIYPDQGRGSMLAYIDDSARGETLNIVEPTEYQRAIKKLAHKKGMQCLDKSDSEEDLRGKQWISRDAVLG